MKKLIQYSMFYALIVITRSILTCPHDGDVITEIPTQEQHQKLLINNQGPSVILYYMNQCRYCDHMKPIFEQLANDDQFDHITFYTVNGPAVHAEQDVKNILNETFEGYPTILGFNHGKIMVKEIGATDHKKLAALLHKINTVKKS